ncbi:MAG: hypothetical protein GY772_00360, partial [bacterium]|nr:hypothetical protein [bacterium]
VTRSAAAAEDEQEWGTKGRFGIYSANFGNVTRPDFFTACAECLASTPATILACQEATDDVARVLRENQWMVTDDRFIGASRGAGGDCLLVAAKSGGVERVETLAELSGSSGPEQERSSHLFAKVVFRWGHAGFGSCVVGTFHLHRGLAGRGDGARAWNSWMDGLAAACRACGARLLTGDANMALFHLAPALEARGLQATLVACHRECNVSETVDFFSEAG